MTESLEVGQTVGITQETDEGLPRRVEVDWGKGEEVLGRLLGAFNNDDFPYNLDSVRVPHDPRHMPETMPRGGVEHAMFLWSTCYYMRGGTKSVDSLKLLANVYDAHPDLFDTDRVAEQDPLMVADLLKSFHLGYQHIQIGRFWVENAKRMQHKWQGDPRNIFDGVTDYDECLTRVSNDKKGGGFFGFQKKMTSMILYYLMDDELIEPFVFPLPVDMHVMRISIAHEILRFIGYDPDDNLLSDEVLDFTRNFYYSYALKHGIDPLRLCDAIWLLSQSLCGKQPGNVTLEPEGRKNRNGRKTILIPLPVRIEDVSQQNQYEHTCRSCPVESTCVWNVPGKIYYVQGDLKRRGKRVIFPESSQGRLFVV